MADIFMIKTVGTGWQGAPGQNTFIFDTDPLLTNRENADQALQLVSDFYDTMKEYLVVGSSWAPDSEVNFYDDQTGILFERYISGEVIPSVSGTDTTLGNSRATMVVSKLVCNDVVNGRVLTGRHFIGPIGDQGIDSEGSLTQEIQQQVAQAYAGMIDVVGPNLSVWHRPTAKGADDGQAGRVRGAGVSMSVPGVLRSRRD